SPEQVRGESLDARSDLFSLGAVLQEMVSGMRAFPGASMMESGYAILHHEPTPLPGDLPPPVARVIGHCLEKEPARRFQSATDLAFDLEELGSPVTGSRAAQTGSPSSSPRAKGPWTIGGAALLLLLSAAIVGQLARSRLPTAPSPTAIEQITYRPGTVGN